MIVGPDRVDLMRHDFRTGLGGDTGRASIGFGRRARFDDAEVRRVDVKMNDLFTLERKRVGEDEEGGAVAAGAIADDIDKKTFDADIHGIGNDGGDEGVARRQFAGATAGGIRRRRGAGGQSDPGGVSESTLRLLHALGQTLRQVVHVVVGGSARDVVVVLEERQVLTSLLQGDEVLAFEDAGSVALVGSESEEDVGGAERGLETTA